MYESAVSVICLSPDHFRREDSRPVSCYAIFKGWLLLSQPPGCLRILTSSSCTEHIFRDLNWRSGLFPFRPMELLPHSLTAALWPNGIRSLIRVTRFLPVHTFQCSTPVGNTRRQPKSCFGENQLLRNSISFSLLTTSHPMVLNGQPVRASTKFYLRFTLLMVSSSRFGSYPHSQLRAIHARFHLASGVFPLRQRM